MRRFQSLASLLLFLAAAAVASAQPVFKVVPSTLPLAEGEMASVLLIQTGDDHFSVRIPQGYGTQVNPETRSIVFTAESGLCAITVRASTNFPGVLPKIDYLGGIVARKYPAATLVESSPCVSEYGPGLCFDFVQTARNNLSLRIRDAYVPYPNGSFEFIFSCNGSEYDKNRLSFVWLLNSFRSETKPVKKEP